MSINNIKESTSTRRRRTNLQDPQYRDLQHRLQQNKELIAILENQKKQWQDHFQRGQREYEHKKHNFETLKEEIERSRKRMDDLTQTSHQNIAQLTPEVQVMEQKIIEAQAKHTALRRELQEKRKQVPGNQMANDLLEEKREILKQAVAALNAMKPKLKECKAAVEIMTERRRREAEQEEAEKKRQEEEDAKRRKEEKYQEARRRFEAEFMRFLYQNYPNYYNFYSSYAPPPPQQNQTNQTTGQPRNEPADDPDDGKCPFNRALVDKWLNDLYTAQNKASLNKVYRKGALFFHPDKLPEGCSPSYVKYGEEIFKAFGGYYKQLVEYFEAPRTFLDGKPKPPVAPTKRKNP